MYSLGIHIGASSLKLVLLDDSQVVWRRILPHEGDFRRQLTGFLREAELPSPLRVLATGTEGRFSLRVPSLTEAVCVEAALREQSLDVNAVVSLGGENFVVYRMVNGQLETSFSGNKCASGTGEFFKQQLGRMDMRLEDVPNIASDARVYPLSTRCSVFMKSDCTHKLNKGEATPADIVLSLSDVMAAKVGDFLKRASVESGPVLLFGGVTRNQHILRFLEERMPEVDFIVPEDADSFEAYGAALLAGELGGPMPDVEKLLARQEIPFASMAPLHAWEKRVQYLHHRRGQLDEGRPCILGVDGGSTTTKVVLVDSESGSIVAAHYGRTHGDPVRALKQCLAAVETQLGELAPDVDIQMVATTGSSREILGMFLETDAVFNEIIAHAAGTASFFPEVDTVFEIGGQDAKYINLENGVAIDYAMNEACSAGTGSFLEESASGDLNIGNVEEIGGVALQADAPLKFGENCSAFINSDIRKAIQYGATREDITAGVVYSIVANYLNRVVGNRFIGQRIALQGGVAKNPAVPLAFAAMMDRDIVVPPEPELLGCYGVALLARERLEQAQLAQGRWSIGGIQERSIEYAGEFVCKSCDNLCSIRKLRVNGHRHFFGGRCSKYTGARRRVSAETAEEPVDYLARRETLFFQTMTPDKGNFRKKYPFKVAVPRAFSVYTLWPFYSWLFHELGIEAELSDTIAEAGMARVESGYCFPAELAHGAVQSLLAGDYAYIFVPHFRDMPSMEGDVHACLCPITQGFPYYIKKAFPEVADERWLAPVVSFKYGPEKALEGFREMGRQLGIADSELRRAFDVAREQQQACEAAYLRMGREALAEIQAAKRPTIALLGRPYNAFTRDANMGIPRKFLSRGYSVLPFDMLPVQEQAIFDNMYWYYGQQDMKSAAFIQGIDNLFITFISNFSCAPDSFMLHYVRWMLKSKPFLVLELDSHTADAGVDTRVEAFLDVVNSYRERDRRQAQDDYDNGLRFINDGTEDIHLYNEHTGKKIPIFNNSDVKMLLSNMGQFSAELMAASVRSVGISAEAMPVPTSRTLQLARSHMSGKECLPSQLVLGSALQYFGSEKYNRDTTYMLFVPSTTGPCRTGQYAVYYKKLFQDLKLPNVLVVFLSSENSYSELGRKFMKNAWWGLAIADRMKDIETSLRTRAENPEEALQLYRRLWQRLIRIAERGGMARTLPALREIAGELARIPLKKREKLPRVLVVGEIYVRRDDFAVRELVDKMAERGIIAKVSGIEEWLYYCDYMRRYELRKRLRLQKWYRRPFSAEFRELALWRLEAAWKQQVGRRIEKALAPSGLLLPVPEHMDRIMNTASRHFVSTELESEITISSGAAATAMEEGYSGVVNISPFACLIGRVIEGVYTPWARQSGYPVISVEIDGDGLPTNLISKLEIFMLNVLRFRRDAKLAEMVDRKDDPDDRCSRKSLSTSVHS